MRYCIGIASKQHVYRGIAGGFCQLCHGGDQPLKRMSVGNWIIYYSPDEQFDGTSPCQQFTAIGEVVGSEIYPFEMFPGFVPHSRDIRFIEAKNAPIRPLLDSPSFIKDKIKWGYAFRFGHIEITRQNLEPIVTGMLGYAPPGRSIVKLSW